VEAGRALFRRHYTPYYANPVYNDFLRWAGYQDEAEGVLAGWAARDRQLSTGSITDELVDSVAIIGTAEEVHERLREHAADGIDTSIVSPIGPIPLAEAMPTFEAFAGFRFAG